MIKLLVGGAGLTIAALALSVALSTPQAPADKPAVNNGLKAYPKFWDYMTHNARGHMMFCDRPGKYSCPLSGHGWVLDSYQGRHVLCVSVYDPAELARRAERDRARSAEPPKPVSPFQATKVEFDVGPLALYDYCFDADTGERAWYKPIYSTSRDADLGLPPLINCPDNDDPIETAKCFGLDTDWIGGTEAYLAKHPEIKR